VRAWLLALLLAGCGAPDRPHVAAAASLSGVVRELLGGTGARATFAASSTLARQVDRGLGADLFLSADRPWVEWLMERGFGGTPRPVARNALVAWVRAGGDAPRTPEDLKDPRWGRIAVGGAAVPVGRYARAAVAGLGLEERFLPCLDAPAVLQALLRGGAGVAVCYATDGRGVPGVVEALRFEGTDIVYWALPLGPGADALLARLEGPAAQAAWRRHGFLPVE